jgi:hypothetical protein
MDSGEMTITKPVCYHSTDSGSKHQGFDRNDLPFLVMRAKHTEYETLCM